MATNFTSGCWFTFFLLQDFWGIFFFSSWFKLLSPVINESCLEWTKDIFYFILFVFFFLFFIHSGIGWSFFHYSILDTSLVIGKLLTGKFNERGRNLIIVQWRKLTLNWILNFTPPRPFLHVVIYLSQLQGKEFEKISTKGRKFFF